MNYGFIYCMGNPCMPGVYKVGMTERAPAIRCAELSGSTSSPNPFNVLCFGQVEDPRQVESMIHQYLDNYRVSSSREFFRVDYSVIEGVIIDQSDAFAETVEGAEEKEKERIRIEFLDAEGLEAKLAALIECARLEGIRFWRDGDTLHNSGYLHMSSWIAGAVHAYGRQLLEMVNPKEVASIISLAESATADPERGLDW